MNLSVQKLTFSAAWLILLSAVTMMCILFYWNFVPYVGLRDVVQPLLVSAKSVERGSMITYRLNYCVDESLPLPLTVQRNIELQNGDPKSPVGFLPIAPTAVYLIEQRCESRDIFVGIPVFVPVGQYHIHTDTELQVNPIRVIRQRWVSADFQIVPSSKFEILPKPLIKK